MKTGHTTNYSNSSSAFCALLVLIVVLFSSCSKQSGYSLPPTTVNSVIQLSVNNTSYALASAPDAISFSTLAISTAKPNLRQYLIKGNNASGTLTFSLNFHVDSLGSVYYVMDNSTLLLNAKTYISTAKKSTDKVVITTLDDQDKIYKGTFSFYSFNQASATDSVLVSGIYSIQ